MCTKLQTVVKKNTHGSNKPTRSQVYLGGGGGGGGRGGSLARGTSGSPFSSAAQPCGHGDEPRLSHFQQTTVVPAINLSTCTRPIAIGKKFNRRTEAMQTIDPNSI